MGRRIPVLFGIHLTDEMLNLKYTAQGPCVPEGWFASDSLGNLKKAVRAKGWKVSWITCPDNELFSLGQGFLTETYPYHPKY